MWRVVDNPGAPRGLLGDQAHVAGGLLALYEATGEPDYLAGARRVMAFAESELHDPASGVFRDCPSDAEAIGALAACQSPFAENAIAAQVLLRLHILTREGRYRDEAESVLRAFADQYPAYGVFASAYAQATRMLLRPTHVAVVGAAADPVAEALWQAGMRPYAPGTVRERLLPQRDALAIAALGYPADGQSAAYVCAGEVCERLTTSEAVAAAMLR